MHALGFLPMILLEPAFKLRKSTKRAPSATQLAARMAAARAG